MTRSRNAEAIDLVGTILQSYADRGVFRAFTRGPVKGGKATFRMVWHHDRRLEMIMEPASRTLRFPAVLPGMPSGSEIYGELKKFLASRHSDELPEHRRIDTHKAHLQPLNRGGEVSLRLTVDDSDYEYGARKIIHIVDEVFKNFLGDYYEYQVEHLGLDPDQF